jgi:hypothetical protein
VRVAFYFLLIGLAFLFVEIAFIHRFSLFLGHPLAAISVTLAGFLVSAGLGSGISKRVAARWPEGAIMLAIAAIVSLGAVYAMVLPPLLGGLMGLSLPAKIAVAVGLLSPLGFVMGLPFPLGHHAAPPVGLSRDLLIRVLAYELQERAQNDANAALRRRLQSLAAASEKGDLAVHPGIVLKAGTALVRQWRGHTHTVLVHKDGFEHEGQRYRSLTVIAERITGAHWSGPRFFGLTKRAYTSLPRTNP